MSKGAPVPGDDADLNERLTGLAGVPVGADDEGSAGLAPLDPGQRLLAPGWRHDSGVDGGHLDALDAGE
jgi:hypothetical protein